MEVKCKKCNIVYKLDDSKIPASGVKIKCKKCNTIYQVKKKSTITDTPETSSIEKTVPSQEKKVAEQKATAHTDQKPDESQNRLIEFEAELKKLQRLVHAEGNTDTTLTKARGSFRGLMSAYQTFKKEVSGKEKRINELQKLIEVGQVINSVLDMDELLNVIMDMVIKVVEAERGFLMLKDLETGELIFKVARNMDDAIKDKSLFTVSSGITGSVVRDGKAVLTSDAQDDTRFSAQASVMDNKLRSVMCVPIRSKDEIIGTIFVDNRMLSGAFTENSVELLSSFADQAGIAIENARLYENVADETRKRSSLQRYLSPTVVNDIINKKEDVVLGGERIECSVLFTDICGFTSLSEKLEPEVIVKMLNEYFTEMTKIIFENQGTIDKFIGDAIMAIFGAPVFTPLSSQNAVKAGIDMLTKLRELQKKWEADNKPSFKIRVGINTGIVIAGNLGSLERMDYTVIGDNVNLASRLESNAEPMNVLISDTTYKKIKDIVTAKEMEPIKVKGKEKPVQTYQVSDIKIKKIKKAKIERTHERKQVSIFATFKVPPSSKNNQCIILDISVGGLLMSTRDAIAIGDYLQFDITLPDKTKFNNITGMVSIVRPFKDKSSKTFFKVGIAFESLTDEDTETLNNFIES